MPMETAQSSTLVGAEQVRSLFDAARSIEPAEWAEWLHRHHPNDEVRRTVLDLLQRVREDLPGYRPSNGLDDSLVGRSLASWRIERRIGGGGMGRVYRAANDAGAVAALKVLRPEIAGSGLERRWAREVGACRAASDPSIAQLLDCGADDVDGQTLHWLAVELVESATSLTDHAIERGLCRADRVALLLRVLRGVERAHGKGVIHGDLKPSNLLVDESGRLRIVDFGLARVIGARSDHTLVCATPGFTAPEQFLPHAAPSVASDIYSLGRLTHVLLDRGDAPADPVDVAIADVVRRATHAEPDKRYRSAALMARALAKAARAERPRWMWTAWASVVVALPILAALPGRPSTPCLTVPDPIAGDWLGHNLTSTNHYTVASREVAGSSAVFRWTGTRWLYDGALVPPDGVSTNGSSGPSAMTGDSIFVGLQTATVGGQPNAGVVVEFQRGPRGWKPIATLAASEPQAGAYFGRSVASDGASLVVGAGGERGEGNGFPLPLWSMDPAGNAMEGTFHGAAYVFTRDPDGHWAQRQVLRVPGGPMFEFGFAVDVEGDRILVSNQSMSGVPRVERGSVFVFRRAQREGEFRLVQRIGGLGERLGSAFGWRFASRGRHLAVPAHASGSGEDSYVGIVNLYSERDRVGYESIGNLNRGRAGDNIGVGVAMGWGYVAAARAGGLEIYELVDDNAMLRSTLVPIDTAPEEMPGNGFSNAVTANNHGVLAASIHAAIGGRQEAGRIHFWPTPALGLRRAEGDRLGAATSMWIQPSTPDATPRPR